MNVVIGRGQIGSAIIELLEGTELYSYDIQDRLPLEPRLDTAVLHIAIPYSKEFINQVKGYQAYFQPQHTIIYSTVPVGTSAQVQAVHSPVEGKHPDLAASMRLMPRWVGYDDINEAQFFYQFFTKLGLVIRTIPETRWTEFLKLRSTAKYGINLVWTDYEAKVADELGMDFALLKEFDKNYNKLYYELGMDWAQRYILDPPKGKIGGHCVVPNAEILDDQFPSDMLKKIKDMK